MWGEAHETLSDCGNSIGLRRRRRIGRHRSDRRTTGADETRRRSREETVRHVERESPFRSRRGEGIAKTLDEGATKTAALFPDNSKTGGGTAALPAIWQNKADFDARFVKFKKDVEAAQAGVVDEATFKKFAPTVFENCGGCHELYKAKSG